MKFKVVSNFIDKNTGKVHKKGEFYECDKKRFNEIQAQGIFLKEEKQPKKEKAGFFPIEQ